MSTKQHSRNTLLAQDGFASVRDASAFLGIGRSTMYDLVNGNVISHARISGRVLVPWKSLREYAASRIRLGTVA